MSSRPYRVGQWLPSDPKVLDKWLDNLIKKVEADPIYRGKLQALEAQHPPAESEESAEKAKYKFSPLPLPIEFYTLHEPVEKLKEAILSDPEINMFFHQMFWQQYSLPDSSEGVKIPTWHLMIILIDYIMTTAPEFNESGLVGFPINVILNWPMNTTAGFAAFLNDKVNTLFKNILNYWADTWLNTPASCSVLTTKSPGGWFSKEAMKAMPGFVDDYECDPNLPHYGFKSWDEFFTRKFRPGRRAVASPDDNYIVANACESAPYKLDRGVKHKDFFWIKGQRYSLDFILNMNPVAKKFYGGTVYQAFLSATSYHRWHSPVSGIIHKTELVDGSYYSQTHNIQNDPASPNMSQGYLAQVAARGIIYIQADNDDIGLMCFVSIGMSEVSSNEITVKEGQRVEKGDELGMFHFGGSTHLLIFRPQVDIQFDFRGQEPGLDSTNINVKAKIAEVKKPKK
ncbi:L-tryptophan decarboxylase-like isoform X2 [Acropora millepora]|uniref:L-tryptophan decarboxylase-like isoform X2 n=1 Tax=Acropora millepora TaxID=45264 RepID=UPI001CF132B9|nr:L-tryptophan decarboxylase-like isoform X2 [Acropora millepora]